MSTSLFLETLRRNDLEMYYGRYVLYSAIFTFFQLKRDFFNANLRIAFIQCSDNPIALSLSAAGIHDLQSLARVREGNIVARYYSIMFMLTHMCNYFIHTASSNRLYTCWRQRSR